MRQYKVIIKEESGRPEKLLRYEPKAYKKAIGFIGAYGHYDDKKIIL